MAAPYLYLPYIGVAIMAVLVFDADATWLQALVRSIAFGIAAYFVWLHHRLSHAIRATNSRKLRRDIEKRLTFATYFEDIACDYDPVATQALERFDPVKHATHCVFARKSRLWGSRDWDDRLDLAENTRRSAAMLARFVRVANAPPPAGLDGFVIEIRGEELCSTLEAFGESVRIVLKTLSDIDPAGAKVMDKGWIAGLGWRFSYCNESFFVSAFAPCYGGHSSRYMFGVEGSGFVLLQPDFSFGHHPLMDADTPFTNWESPKTAREQTRVAFKRHGRAYMIPPVNVFPAAPLIVRPLNELTDPPFEWWIPLAERQARAQASVTQDEQAADS